VKSEKKNEGSLEEDKKTPGREGGTLGEISRRAKLESRREANLKDLGTVVGLGKERGGTGFLTTVKVMTFAMEGTSCHRTKIGYLR